MSAAPATEAENGNPITSEAAVVAQFNTDLLDITTGDMGMKQPMGSTAEGNDTFQTNIKGASTEAGATEDNVDKIENFASTNGVDFSTAQDIDLNTRVSSFEHAIVDVPTATHEDHKLVDSLSDMEKETASDDKAPEVDSMSPSSVHHEDVSNSPAAVASTIPPESEAIPVLNNASTPAAQETGSELFTTQDQSLEGSPLPAKDVTVSPSPVIEDDSQAVSVPEEETQPVSVVDADTALALEQDVIPDTEVAEKQSTANVTVEKVEAETTFSDSVSPGVAADALEETAITEAPEPSDPTVVVSKDEALPDEVPNELFNVPASGSPIESSFTDVGVDVAETPVIELSPTPFEAEPVAESTHEEEPQQVVIVEGEAEGTATEGTAPEERIDNTDTSRLAAQESEIERPKSPWTPSYSVTTQGPGIVGPPTTRRSLNYLFCPLPSLHWSLPPM
ncbi:hypothetical protein DFH09DRAFT_321464 [Mycena vulgaris]|nr:hypothetical protein DFH09DRAFT_321464 [Mycena vulgaris]